MKLIVLLLLSVLLTATYGFNDILLSNQWVKDTFLQPITQFVGQHFDRINIIGQEFNLLQQKIQETQDKISDYQYEYINILSSENKPIENSHEEFELTHENMNSQTRRDLMTYTIDPGYSNPNDKYSPSSNVQNGHRLSRVEAFGGYDMVYLREVAKSVVLFFALGLLSLIFLNLGLLFRCCCKCCKCFPRAKLDATHEEAEALVKSHRTATTVSFYLFILFILIADLLVYVGYGSFIAGMETVSDAMDLVALLFQDIYDACGDIVGYSDKIQVLDKTVSDNCPYYPSIAGDLKSLSTNLEDVREILDPLIDQIQNASDNVVAYAGKYIFYALLAIFLFAITVIIVMVISHCCRSSCGLKFGMFWSMFMFFIIIILNIPFHFLTSFFGDYCMDPTLNTVSFAYNTSEALHDTMSYYLTCKGDSEFGPMLNTSQELFLDLNFTIYNLTATAPVFQTGGSCVLYTPDLREMGSTFIDMGLGFVSIFEIVGCERIQEIWFKFINEALCGDIYDGIYSIWLSQLVTSFFIFVVILIVSFSYQHIHHDREQSKVFIEGDDQAYGGEEGGETYGAFEVEANAEHGKKYAPEEEDDIDV